MPQILDFFAGAGQGLAGAQSYFRGKQSLQAGEQRIQANELALERAQRLEAEAKADRQREEGYRQAMSEAVGQLMDIEAADPQTTDPLAQVATPWAAMVGVGRTMGEISSWLKGKDAQTSQAMQRLRDLTSRIAKTDPQAALNIAAQGAESIKGRVIQQAVGHFQSRGANKIRKLGELAANGRISEDAATAFQDQIEQVMSVVEANPQNMAQGEQALSKVDQALEKEMKAQDDLRTAQDQLAWLAQRPGGYDGKKIAAAQRMLERGDDPDKVLKWVGAAQDDWNGGPLEDAPQALRIKWDSEARQLAREWAAKTLDQGDLEEPKDYMERLWKAAHDYLPYFREEVYGQNGVIPSQGPSYAREQSPTATDLAFIQSRMKRGQPAAVTAGAQAGQEGAVSAGIKRNKNETLPDFIDRVLKEVGARGGSRQDVIATLKAAGLTPEKVRAALAGKK